ncbi:MAG: hypothetical protein ABSF92_04575 [Candidatus Acidiferrales bacterium]
MQKTANGVSTVYIYAGGSVIAEYDNGAGLGTPSREYIYSGGTLQIPLAAPNVQPPLPLACQEAFLRNARRARQNALDRAMMGVDGPEAGFTVLGDPAQANYTGLREGTGGNVELGLYPGSLALFHVHPPSYPGHPSGYSQVPSIPGHDATKRFEGRDVYQYIGADQGLFVSAPGGYQTIMNGTDWLTQNPCVGH